MALPRRRHRRARLAALGVTAALALPTLAAACGEADGDVAVVEPTTSITTSTTVRPSSEGTTSPTLASPPNPVRLTGAGPDPARIEVAVGDTVTFINDDGVEHWIVTPGEDDINSATLRPGSSYAETFEAAGTYRYECNIHDGYGGTVVVR